MFIRIMITPKSSKTASSVKVVVGTVNLKEPYSTHQADQIIVHEEYVSSRYKKSDIALIKVIIKPNQYFIRNNVIRSN